MNKDRIRAALLATSIFIATTAAVRAQQTPAPADGEIIVTAQKRSESLQGRRLLCMRCNQPTLKSREFAMRSTCNMLIRL